MLDVYPSNLLKTKYFNPNVSLSIPRSFIQTTFRFKKQERVDELLLLSFLRNEETFETMNFVAIDDKVPEDVGRHILSFLDVPTLVRKKAVCRSWRILFTNTIRQKASTPQAFQSSAELKAAVTKYTRYNLVDAEEFAITYGWPIAQWDVSNIQDFNHLFEIKRSFNENIGSWDVSSATSTAFMFNV
eukprot:scaffold50490_cov52-Attheya_sp.AAC.3